MSRPGLDPDLAAALEVVAAELGPVQVLDVHPTPPRRPAPPPAPAGPESIQPSLFDPTPEPAPSTSTSAADPFGHIPPSWRWRPVLRHARPPSPASPSTWRSP
jgi:hypothetical protein